MANLSEKERVLDLAKLVIAASWADGELSNDEVNALKDLIFSLDDVSGEDWSVLEMYLESPVSEEEREALLQRVTDSIRSKEDKAYTLSVLEQLFGCDGAVTEDEQALMDQLQQDISTVSTGLLSGMTKAFKSAIGQRKSAVDESCLREMDSNDYVMNTIYYDLKRQIEDGIIRIERSEAELRKLCLATGLLSHLAYTDDEISAEEEDAIRSVLEADWKLTPEQAAVLAKMACDRATRGLDYYRLSQGYFSCTEVVERQALLVTLFHIANAADKTDHDEIEQIRTIATSLKLTHQDFIGAKLTISREDRGGL